MSEVIRENDFIKVSLIKTEYKVIDRQKVLNKVNDYLAANLIDGTRYSCIGFRVFDNSEIEVALFRVYDNFRNNGHVDGDFESDDGWREFCSQMKELLELRRFSVPNGYYHA